MFVNCLTVRVVSYSGALSDERSSLSFVAMDTVLDDYNIIYIYIYIYFCSFSTSTVIKCACTVVQKFARCSPGRSIYIKYYRLAKYILNYS
jgi:hypothetical protein